MKKLTKKATITLMAGASEARCNRMANRLDRRNEWLDSSSRLYARWVKNCYGYE